MRNGDVKVITGLRRCGKSVLLFDLFADYLIKNVTDEEHIIKIALDQRRFFKFRNPVFLCEYVEETVSKRHDEEFFLFIDEVQLTQRVKDRESGIEISIYDMLNELRAYKNLDIYVTGSNSKALSSDIATEFRGRATQIHVYPLSFAEFYSVKQGDEQRALEEYMVFGGMPRVVLTEDEEDKKRYLLSLYDELYIKDIVERNKITKEDLMNEILDFLASQTGSLTNPTKIANTVATARKEKINPTLVSAYIDHAVDSFLLSVAKRYDIKGKSYFSYPNKYYYTDIGLRNARLNFRQYDPGHIMENIIYNELLTRGYSVDVGVVYDRKNGKNATKEIDFVVNSGDKRIYIQSAFGMVSEEKEKAETASFALTDDFFKKIIIQADIPRSYYDESGIFRCKIEDFLLNKVDLL